ncbi:MAG: ScpA family protein [Candidatus Liptonbacteria bacterium]
MTYELKLAQYSGPLEKLLELIEARQMEITEISLAAVTDDFFHYLEDLRKKEAGISSGNLDMRILADFIVVASRLIFIKSKSLLPDFRLTGEEEGEIKDLEWRLKFYREFRPALKKISELWRTRNSALARPYFMNLATWMMPRPDLECHENGGDLRFFYPGENLNPRTLLGELHHLLDIFEAYVRETEVVREKIVSLDEKIGQIIEKFKNIKSASFKDVTNDSSRADTIIAFLAILHLAGEQILMVEQKGLGSDIIITRNHA